MMASIGKGNGVEALLGFEVQGVLAWWIWRSYYLANLPTLQKKIRVMVGWTLDFFFRRDVTMLETILRDKGESKESSPERREQDYSLFSFSLISSTIFFPCGNISLFRT